MSSPKVLHHIYAGIDQRVLFIVSAEPSWPCQKGCDFTCCVMVISGDAIQILHEAGMDDGVVLGNYQVIQRELNEQFGAAQSIVAWFAQVFGGTMAAREVPIG